MVPARAVNKDVKWYLSIDKADLPDKTQKTYRSITINDEEMEFSDGFTDLHTLSYKGILNGNGFGIDETKPSLETVYEIRNSTPIGLKGEYHSFLKNIK